MRTPQTPPTPTVEHDGFLDIKESVAELGCGERWLRDGINHRGFPHHRLGKSLQTSRQDRAEIRKMCRVPASRVPAQTQRTTASAAA